MPCAPRGGRQEGEAGQGTGARLPSQTEPGRRQGLARSPASCAEGPPRPSTPRDFRLSGSQPSCFSGMGRPLGLLMSGCQETGTSRSQTQWPVTCLCGTGAFCTCPAVALAWPWPWPTVVLEEGPGWVKAFVPQEDGRTLPSATWLPGVRALVPAAGGWSGGEATGCLRHQD